MLLGLSRCQLLPFLFGEGSPQIDYRERGALILTSILEDQVAANAKGVFLCPKHNFRFFGRKSLLELANLTKRQQRLEFEYGAVPASKSKPLGQGLSQVSCSSHFICSSSPFKCIHPLQASKMGIGIPGFSWPCHRNMCYWKAALGKPAPYQRESLGKCRKVKLTGMDMFHATLNLESESFARGPYRQLRSACGAIVPMMHRGNLGNVFASGGPFRWLASCWFLNRPQNLPEFDTSIIECITQVAYNPQNPFEPQRASFFLGANRRFFDVRLQNP